MNYFELVFNINPYRPFADILIADLADMGFESFVEENNSLKAYIPEVDFLNENLDELLDSYPEEVVITYEICLIEDKNWNEEWEKNFQPVEIDNYCRIRAPFHSRDDSFEHEVIIEPKMSFGTGHHATTFLMIESIKNLDLPGKAVLDMGCGTGVLAILAEKEGADQITAIDIEDWAFENTQENIERNNCTKTKAFKGGAELLQSNQFDIIFANINRNILMRDMEYYVKSMRENAQILLSGFFESDVEVLKSKASELGLEFLEQRKKEDWCLLKFSI